jgi:hypothetical protein
MNRLTTLLAVTLLIVGAAYSLQHGLYVGSFLTWDGTGKAWRQNCRYFYLSAIVTVSSPVFETKERALGQACKLFRD